MKKAFEKILERLEREIAVKPTPEEYDNGINRAYSIVQEVAEEFATDTNVGTNGWIACSDRLPERKKQSFGNKQKRTNVLVTLRNGVVKEMTYEFATKEFWEAGDENHIEH